MLGYEVHNIEFKISDTDLTLERILEKPYTPKKYVEEISKADIVLFPYENFREHKGVFFPETTNEFYDYLKEKSYGKLLVDIACDDENFSKLELHSASIVVVSFIVTSIALPIAINLVSNFLYDEVKKYNRKASDLCAELTIVVQDEDKSKQLTYKGTIAGIKDTLEGSMDKLFDK